MKVAITLRALLARTIKPTVAALFLLAVLHTAPAHAADIKPKEAPAEVLYLGTVAGKPVFQILFTNTTGEKVSISLRDEAGNVIFSDVSSEKNYTRKLQFDELDTEKIKLKLTLRTKKETQTQAFEITKNTRVIEDVAVVTL